MSETNVIESMEVPDIEQMGSWVRMPEQLKDTAHRGIIERIIIATNADYEKPLKSGEVVKLAIENLYFETFNKYAEGTTYMMDFDVYDEPTVKIGRQKVIGFVRVANSFSNPTYKKMLYTIVRAYEIKTGIKIKALKFITLAIERLYIRLFGVVPAGAIHYHEI